MWKSPAVEEGAYLASSPCAGRNRALGFAIGAVLVACAWGFVATSSSSPATSSLSSRDGDLEVGYMVQESPSTATGSTIRGVTSIEFYPSYIVVKTKNGAGRTFFSERTTKFDWTWHDKSATGPSGR
jgi:hypothetical protein